MKLPLSGENPVNSKSLCKQCSKCESKSQRYKPHHCLHTQRGGAEAGLFRYAYITTSALPCTVVHQLIQDCHPSQTKLLKKISVQCQSLSLDSNMGLLPLLTYRRFKGMGRSYQFRLNCTLTAYCGIPSQILKLLQLT